jgi:cation transport ATPase
VIAGTVNGSGSLRIEVTGTGDKTALAGIMRLVAQAQTSRSFDDARRAKRAARPDRRGFEDARNVNAVFFDKTGTLTRGEFRVVDITTREGLTADEALALARSRSCL